MLCVFFIAKSKGYVCPNDLGHLIKARTTLSDLILKELIPTPQGFGYDAYPFSPVVSLAYDNNRFEYYQGNHVPLLYNTLLEKEEGRTNIPFTDYFQSEWNNTFEYQPSKATTIDYFFSGERQRSTGQFYTQASHRGRSAYLRTIELAKGFYGMPDSYAEHLSIPALPIEPAYLELRPQKPKWLPVWNNKNTPNKEHFTSFVKQALANFSQKDGCNHLLAFSLPIKIDDNNWIDLTAVKVSSETELTPNLEIQDRSNCFAVGNLLNKELSYELGKGQNNENPTLAGTSYPFMRYGHWHSDLESRGLYIPRCTLDDKNIIGSSSSGLYYYNVDGANIGFSAFWYNDWQSIHPKGIRSLCGSYTAVSKEKLGAWLGLSAINDESIYLCQAIVLKSEDNYRDYQKQVINFFVREE